MVFKAFLDDFAVDFEISMLANLKFGQVLSERPPVPAVFVMKMLFEIFRIFSK